MNAPNTAPSVARRAYCGRQLCKNASMPTRAHGLLRDCNDRATRARQGFQMILPRSAQSARASAFPVSSEEPFRSSGGLAWYVASRFWILLQAGRCAVFSELHQAIGMAWGAKRQSTDSP